MVIIMGINGDYWGLMMINGDPVGGLEHFLFFHIVGIIIPTD